MEECKIYFLTARCDFERTFVGGINTKVHESRPICDRRFSRVVNFQCTEHNKCMSIGKTLLGCKSV